MYKERPKNPIDFFANWLLLEDIQTKRRARELKEEELLQMMKDKHLSAEE